MGDQPGETPWLGIMCATIKICVKCCGPIKLEARYRGGKALEFSESGWGEGFGVGKTAQAKAGRQTVGNSSDC